MTADEARTLGNLGAEWQEVTTAETREIGDLCVRERRVFNGCTNAELCTRYGRENVRHVMGFGWFKRESAR